MQCIVPVHAHRCKPCKQQLLGEKGREQQHLFRSPSQVGQAGRTPFPPPLDRPTGKLLQQVRPAAMRSQHRQQLGQQLLWVQQGHCWLGPLHHCRCHLQTCRPVPAHLLPLRRSLPLIHHLQVSQLSGLSKMCPVTLNQSLSACKCHNQNNHALIKT